MIIKTGSGKSFDTERDMTAAERHILQKLMIWESMASTIDEFRQKRGQALIRGWNNSGPLQESDVLKTIVDDMEERVILRLSDRAKP
jgi:hypothetical protein